MMSQRTIRAFHYTRLTENEAMVLRQEGIHLSTPLSLLRRISEVVAAGGLSGATAELLYARSPFQSDQLEARLGKFWMTSHPVVVTDSGVEPLLKRWGGEVASMWIRDKAVCAKLETLGKPRIIEVAAPLRVTNQSYQAGKAITATFARSRGSIPSKQAFDLYTKQPLEPAAVLQVHTEGDPSFTEMGVNYPPDYVDVDIGRWKELTGEED